jgi:hypothetical protein
MAAEQNPPSTEMERIFRSLALRADDISPDNRRRLSAPGLRAFLRIAEQWHLSEDERARLLGMSDDDFTEQSRAAMVGEKIELPVDLLLRISAILGTYGALRTIFQESQRAASWIRAPNEVFGGQSALDIMLSGELAGLMRVRRYLEAELRAW